MSNRAWFFAGLATAAPIYIASGLITRITLRRHYATPIGARHGWTD